MTNRKRWIAIASALCLLAANVAAHEAFSDTQIAAVVMAANQAEIDAGNLAQSKAADQEVRRFARQMVDQHTGVKVSLQGLLREFDARPEDTRMSLRLRSSGKQTLQRLEKLKGRAFDKAYLGYAITTHQSMLDTINRTLLPNAKHSELQVMLVKLRPVLDADRLQALELQSGLGTREPLVSEPRGRRATEFDRRIPAPAVPAPAETGAPAPGESGAPAPGEPGAPTPGESGAPTPGEPGAPAPGEAGAPAPGEAGAPFPGEPGAPLPDQPGLAEPGRP